MGRVKEKTLQKIEDYFARETAMRGTSEIQVTLEDLRKETQLSLVTIYKALDGLIEAGKLEVIQQGNRRSPRVYRYKAEMHVHTAQVNDLTGLTKVIEDLIHELAVKEQAVNAFRAKLASYEALESQVMYRLRLSDDVEIIVRKKAERD